MTEHEQQAPQEPEPQDWDTPIESGATDDGDEGERRRVSTQPLPAYHTDKRFYQIVVWFLGLTMLSCAIGAMLLACYDKEIPDVIVALGSAAVGALAGLFAPSQR